MSLQPSLRPLVVVGNPDAPHTLDIFLDYVCPYSGKMANKIETILKPRFGPGGPHAGKVKVIFRVQPQPWHAVSTLTAEAGLAALRASPENFWAFSLALFKKQAEFYDIPTQDLTIRQIRSKLATDVAASVLPPDAVEKFKDLLELKGAANGGTAVTDDLKYNIKFARQNGIHFSPTFLWDGVEAPEVSSGWEAKEWDEFLAKKVAA